MIYAFALVLVMSGVINMTVNGWRILDFLKIIIAILFSILIKKL